MSRKYLAADESGNFDFRPPRANGCGPTKYFAVGTIMLDSHDAMTALRYDLANLRYDLAERGHDIDVFHASENKQPIRDAVFDVLVQHDFMADVTLLEKSKAQPQTRVNDVMFYKYAWYYHFKWFAQRYFQPGDDLTVVTAALGKKSAQTAFRGVVADVIDQCCHYRVTRRVNCWPASSDPVLQAADYVLWAVMRHVERGDDRSRKLLGKRVRSVYDLWATGTTHYYGPLATSSKSA